MISGEQGEVKVEGPEKVNYNGSVDLTITPKDGYVIDTITVDRSRCEGQREKSGREVV